MNILLYLAVAVVAIAIGSLATILVQRSLARSRAKTIIDEATREGEVIRQKQELKGREAGMKIKDEAERQATQRMQKVQSGSSTSSRARTSASATSSTSTASASRPKRPSSASARRSSTA